MDESGSWTRFYIEDIGIVAFSEGGEQELKVEAIEKPGPALMNLKRVRLERIDDEVRALNEADITGAPAQVWLTRFIWSLPR